MTVKQRRVLIPVYVLCLGNRITYMTASTFQQNQNGWVCMGRNHSEFPDLISHSVFLVPIISSAVQSYNIAWLDQNLTWWFLSELVDLASITGSGRLFHDSATLNSDDVFRVMLKFALCLNNLRVPFVHCRQRAESSQITC